MNRRYVGIDPSSKTGFIILDKDGNVVVEEHIKIKHTDDPKRMIEIWERIKTHLLPDDLVAIEGFSHNSIGRSKDFQYGLGWYIRANLYLMGYDYIKPSPNQVKKFGCGKGNAKKTELVEPVLNKWGYTHKVDDMIDAYIIARIAYSYDHLDECSKLEQNVIHTIENGVNK